MTVARGTQAMQEYEDSMTSSVFIFIHHFYGGVFGVCVCVCVLFVTSKYSRYIRLERSRRFNHAFDWTFALRETTSSLFYKSGETNQRKMY